MFDEVSVFVRGLVLGVIVAAPVGPVGLLCIRRTIQKGLVIGFATGFGAAFADAFFSAVAAFGISAITVVVQAHRDALHVIGGVILLFIAWHMWRDKPRQANAEEVETKYLKRAHIKIGGALMALTTSFVITLTNPATLFGVLAVVATFGGLKSSAEASVIILGIFLGSSLWWAMLSGGVSLLRGHFTEERVMTLNRVTAFALTAIAVWVMIVGVLRFAGYEIPSVS
ncbi:MAG: LysE family transporter [Alphaproteobacteria bacterium]|nr:LysE family transporter [Alphaproteobacteria bacterium]